MTIAASLLQTSFRVMSLKKTAKATRLVQGLNPEYKRQLYHLGTDSHKVPPTSPPPPDPFSSSLTGFIVWQQTNLFRLINHKGIICLNPSQTQLINQREFNDSLPTALAVLPYYLLRGGWRQSIKQHRDRAGYHFKKVEKCTDFARDGACWLDNRTTLIRARN